MSHPASFSSRRPRPWGTMGAGIAAVAACAVRFAGPLLALLGNIGAASASFWVLALAVVAGPPLWAPTCCTVGAGQPPATRRRGPVDLGLPAVGTARDGRVR